jgi:hypothetical protein
MRTQRAIVMTLVGLLLGIAGVWLLSNGSQSVIPGWRTVASAGEPVLILVVGSPAKVAGVEREVSADRVLASSEDGFALREGLLVVSSIDRAGPLLMRAGWRDKPIEIVDTQRARKPAESGASGGDRMAELINKPTLTLAEAREALDSM